MTNISSTKYLPLFIFSPVLLSLNSPFSEIVEHAYFLRKRFFNDAIY
ncbi:hypothetical protein BAT_3911 [Bacillus pumilus ATCC 7061]|nr:hypothetical protein BAT_3911 [Bacillus pumilus ATCC 7061]